MPFSNYVSERVGWYVYALRDPRDARVFYVGKGRGNRVFEHARAALGANEEVAMSPKIELIRAIQQAGREVETLVLRHGLSSEAAAYDVEATVIDTLRLLDPALANERYALTNLVLGHHHAARGLATTAVVSSLYEAPEAPDIAAPAVLIKIPGNWHPAMTPEALYTATRYWWKIGPRREAARYAFSVNRGVVREVYAIESWRAWTDQECDRPGTVRWGFTGHIAQDMRRFVNTSVKHLYKPGEASPVKFVNC